MLNQIAAIHGTGVAASTTSYESIATANGTGSSNSITFSSIPSTYKHLQIRGIVRGATGSNLGLLMRYNGDTGANYAFHFLEGTGSAAGAQGYSSSSNPHILWNTTGSSELSNTYSAVVVDILDYANTNKYKTSRTLSGYDANGAGYIYLNSTLWQNTNAINSITISFSSVNFTTATQFALYGIKG